MTREKCCGTLYIRVYGNTAHNCSYTRVIDEGYRTIWDDEEYVVGITLWTQLEGLWTKRESAPKYVVGATVCVSRVQGLWITLDEPWRIIVATKEFVVASTVYGTSFNGIR